MVINLLDKDIYKTLWKTTRPRRVNILIWTMTFSLLNYSLIVQRKIPYKCLLPSMCPLCLKDLLHLFILCPYSFNCWRSIFPIFNVVWAFDGSLSSNVFQLLRGPLLPKKLRLIWVNMAKALLAEIWSETNQCIFTRKGAGWTLWTRQKGTQPPGAL